MSSEFRELFTLALDHASSPSLPLLKERFKGFEHCHDKATAAAFGYFAAMRDGEKKEEEPCVFNSICAIMDKMADFEDPLVSEEATEIVLGFVYLWLKEGFAQEGFKPAVLDFLKEQFKLYVKPGVI